LYFFPLPQGHGSFRETRRRDMKGPLAKDEVKRHTLSRSDLDRATTGSTVVVLAKSTSQLIIAAREHNLIAGNALAELYEGVTFSPEPDEDA